MHSRYIMTPDGLEEMNEKIEQKGFGFCLNSSCLPFQIALIPGMDRNDYIENEACPLKFYCPSCDEYLSLLEDNPSLLVGHAFGVNFIAQYMQTFNKPRNPYHYQPKLYGFEFVNP